MPLPEHPERHDELTVVSLFSGCGGLDLGAERAGARVVWATDILTYTADAFEQLLPNSEFEVADIRNLHGFPKADIVCGGYPCQPFSAGGLRDPAKDARAALFRDFARAVAITEPMFLVAENVVGMRSNYAKEWLNEQVNLFSTIGRHGYRVTTQVLDAADYGVPQRRRRLFIVGVRKDLDQSYIFPCPTHSKDGLDGTKKWASHGDELHGSRLPLWPSDEFWTLPEDDRTFFWYYMSRNRKALWDSPARTVLANGRHQALHPASETMELVWSRLSDGTKQGWRFTGSYEHTNGHPDRPVLERPRRLSWRECAVLQTFPTWFEPAGPLTRKYEQVGNAVPPALAEAVFRPLVDGSGLVPAEETAARQ